LHCHSSKDFVVAVDAVAGFRKILVLSFPQLQLFCTVLASKTLQTLPKEEDEEEGKTQQSCWVGSKSFAACLLCTRFSVNWTEKDLRRSEQQLLHSSPGDLCNPSKQSPPKKPRGKKKGTTKIVKISPLHHSLYLHQKKTQKPQNKNTHKFSKTKSNHKNLKNTHNFPKTPPPHTKISSKRMSVQNFLNTLLHLPFATITHQNSQTHLNQSIDLHSKKEEEEEEEEKGNKTHKELKDRREKRERERERESLTRVYTRSI
jgi:hypothetical protein